MSKSVLVIGGSGMLSSFCKTLAQDYEVVGVMGRSKGKMNNLKGTSGIVPIFCDYRDSVALKYRLEEFTSKYDKPELIVAWIHSTAPEATDIIAAFCIQDFYEITGHSGSKNSHLSHQHEKTISDMEINYHRIILGRSGDGWLSNDEISKGVAGAIGLANREYPVGNL